MGFLKRLLHMVVVSAREIGKLRSYLDSLRNAVLTEISWEGRYSRSGATYYVRRVHAVLKTSKYEHELHCHVVDNRLFCDWRVNGVDVGTLEIEPTDDLYDTFLHVVDWALRTEITGENRVEFRERPTVEYEAVAYTPGSIWRVIR